MSASVVAGMNASPVLEPAEHIFDLVALAVQHAIMFNADLAIGF